MQGDIKVPSSNWLNRERRFAELALKFAMSQKDNATDKIIPVRTSPTFPRQDNDVKITVSSLPTTVAPHPVVLAQGVQQVMLKASRKKPDGPKLRAKRARAKWRKGLKLVKKKLRNNKRAKKKAEVDAQKQDREIQRAAEKAKAAATREAAAKAAKNKKDLERKQKEVERQHVRKQKELAKLHQAEAKAKVLAWKDAGANVRAARQRRRKHLKEAVLYQHASGGRNMFDRMSPSFLRNQLTVPDARSPGFQQWLCRIMDNQRVRPWYFMDGVSHQHKYQNLHADLKAISNSASGIDGCRESGGTTILQPHQVVAYGMAQLRARDLINTPGLLLDYSTGSGKTLIGLSIMMAFWNKRRQNGKPFTIFLMSTPSNQRDNSLNKLAYYAIRYFSGFHNEIQDESMPPRPFKIHGKGSKPWEDDESITHVAGILRTRLQLGLRAICAPGFWTELSSRRKELYTFKTFSNDYGLKYSKAVDKWSEGHGCFKTEGRSHQLTECVIVVDEIQFLLDPAYVAAKRILQECRDPNNTWCVGMTATPGETADQLFEIMNAVSARSPEFMPRDHLQTRKNRPTKLEVKAMGLVSFAQLQGDFSHFARLNISSQCVPMESDSTYHTFYMKKLSRQGKRFAALLGIAKKLPKTAVTDRELTYDQKCRWEYCSDRKHLFMKTLREASEFIDVKVGNSTESQPNRLTASSRSSNSSKSANSISPRQVANTPKRQGLRERKNRLVYVEKTIGYEAKNDANNFDINNDINGRTTGNLTIRTQDKAGIYNILVSPKLLRLIENVKRLPGKHYIYSSTPRSALLICRLLETQLGMMNIMAVSADAAEKDVKKKYFGLLNNIVTRRSGFDHLRFSGPLQPSVEAVKHAFNTQPNMRVVVGTREAFKGVDLKNISYVHCLSSLPDMADVLQLIGRGPRLCSHASMPYAKRTCQFLMYRLLMPSMQSCPHAGNEYHTALADCAVFDEAKTRWQSSLGFGSVQEQLRVASVDVKLYDDNLHKVYDRVMTSLYQLSCTSTEQLIADRPKITRTKLSSKDKHAMTMMKAQKPRMIDAASTPVKVQLSMNSSNKVRVKIKAIHTGDQLRSLKLPELREVAKRHKIPLTTAGHYKKRKELLALILQV